MHKDCLVEFAGRNYVCVDGGFAKDEPVDIVVRPEDVDIAPASSEFLCGTVKAVVFKGVHYEMHVDCNGMLWRVQSTEFTPVGAEVGLKITPEDIHIMHRTPIFGGDKV